MPGVQGEYAISFFETPRISLLLSSKFINTKSTVQSSESDYEISVCLVLQRKFRVQALPSLFPKPVAFQKALYKQQRNTEHLASAMIMIHESSGLSGISLTRIHFRFTL